ncbi:outer membrane protein assembly factor BamD [Candidatus Methylospira mobilis]|uniref:Outer membrane protein assembly factor BamD n=1 Tax=Candidatus Methylospira mobilis TaxID=1808979 RepID=A0A5Q0BQ16_9GAMM|nr:outer membrane protein assembly factor BamD [Candidatus Methylospira mobilis]QFY44177.1 outer membrane protein assembly factor BamD [Candidatus Methylospira mobilis]
MFPLHIFIKSFAISRLLLIALLALSSSGCSWFDTDKANAEAAAKEEKEDDERAGWTVDQYYDEAKEELMAKNYEKAIKLYEKLEARFPFGVYSLQSQLDIAFAYYKHGEPDSAIAAADRFIKMNPSHPNVDYAHYLRALVNYNRGITFLDRFMPTDSSQRDPGSARDALKDFDDLLVRFPHSPYAEDSKLRIAALRNNLAMYEINVADFYMRRGAYLAAARRGVEVVQKYQRTQAVPKALKMMEQAYRTLEMNDLADDAARVYALNYSGNTLAEREMQELTPAEQVWDFIGFDR